MKQFTIIGLILLGVYETLSQTSDSIVRCRIRDGHTGSWQVTNYTNGFVDKATQKCVYFLGTICGGAESSCPESSECIQSQHDRSYKTCTCLQPVHVPTVNMTSCIRGVPIGGRCDGAEGEREGSTTKCNDQYGICTNGVCACDPSKAVHAKAEAPNECKLKVGQVCDYWQQDCTGICERMSNAALSDPGKCACPPNKYPSSNGFCVNTPE